MEATHTINPWTYLEVKRSKIKVTRRINAHALNAQYLSNEKADELQTWNTDGGRRPASQTSAVTSKVKGQDRKVTWCVDRCWPISRERNVLETPKLVERLPNTHPRTHIPFLILLTQQYIWGYCTLARSINRLSTWIVDLLAIIVLLGATVDDWSEGFWHASAIMHWPVDHRH